MSHHELHNRLPAWALISAAVVAGLLFIATVSYLIFQYRYDGRVYPGVRVAGVSLAGLAYTEAAAALDQKTDELEEGVSITYRDETAIITPQLAASDPDLDSRLFDFDSRLSLEHAFSVGRNEHFFDNIVEQTGSLVAGHDIPLALTADRLKIAAFLKETFGQHERPAENARIILDENEQATIEAEKPGVALEYDAVIDRLITGLEQGRRDSLALEARESLPEVKRADVGDIQSDVDRLLETPAATLKHETETWKLDRTVFASWIGLERRDTAVEVVFAREPIRAYLEKEVAPEVNKEAIEAKLTLANGRVSVWQAGKDGVEVNLEESAQRLAALADMPSEEVQLATTVVSNTVTDQSAEELGLREIIGTGTSVFSGSPANRRHNIRVGADALHGVLLKPGQEFSLLEALGEIDGRNGYKQELVIKGNKTVPEYGGGLCQIGTTVFRATFNTGLPVTQRRNHSYRVSYYEPAGTDATIYDPAPDYRFVNDTQHHILIQARIEGDTLSFDFWGTKDGRKVETTKPVIYNIVQPKPTRIIETTDLAPGQRRCTESAHAGADAYFDTKVTYADGTVREKRFTSHYVPWQAVCLVGKAKEEPKPEEPEVPEENPAPTTPTAEPQ